MTHWTFSIKSFKAGALQLLKKTNKTKHVHISCRWRSSLALRVVHMGQVAPLVEGARTVVALHQHPLAHADRTLVVVPLILLGCEAKRASLLCPVWAAWVKPDEETD